jgi:Sulfotransferase family
MNPYVYIIGLSHSGSTLLSFLLNAHPEVVSVGEVSRLGDLIPGRWTEKHDRCSCRRSFYQCCFWNRTLAGLAARGHGLGPGDPFGDRIEEKLPALVAATLDVSGARVFVDASKLPSQAERLLEIASLDVRFVNLVRDARGVLYSWRKRLLNATAENLVRQWLRQERLRQSVVQRLPEERVYTLQYEELCRAPVQRMSELFAFLEVDPAPDVTSGFKSARPNHIIGNPMRLTDDETIRLDQEWRAVLSSEVLDLLDKQSGHQLNSRNGYTRD